MSDPVMSGDRPELMPWHTTVLENEYLHQYDSQYPSFYEYLVAEELLFDELEVKIVHEAEFNQLGYNRYHKDNLANPNKEGQNWNRTYELIPDDIKGGVLLVHGLTESPYSMRHIADIFYKQGYYVLNIRLPGHGTIPAQLTLVGYDDWDVAVRVGVKQVTDKIGNDVPFMMVGSSTGGALVMHHVLDASIQQHQLRQPEKVILISPMIGINPLAKLAPVFMALGETVFPQAKWKDIYPEFDPHKYNSIPMNAIDQAYELTQIVQSGLEKVNTVLLPSIVTFASVADATVSIDDVRTKIYDQFRQYRTRIDEGKHDELILFDVNRATHETMFYDKSFDYDVLFNRDIETRYTLRILTNYQNPEYNGELSERTQHPGSVNSFHAIQIDYHWPLDFYALSHVSLQFPRDDAVYGFGTVSEIYPNLHLRQVIGENHILDIPTQNLIRSRSNPFFNYIRDKITDHIKEVDTATKGK